MRLVKPVMKKPLRQQNRQIISYVPRTEPAPPEHAIKMDSFRDVWMLRGKYVAFVLMGESFLRSPAFTVPESAQRWANQIRQKGSDWVRITYLPVLPGVTWPEILYFVATFIQTTCNKKLPLTIYCYK